MILSSFWFREALRFQKTPTDDSRNCVPLDAARATRKRYPQVAGACLRMIQLEVTRSRTERKISISACAALPNERQNKNQEPELQQ